MCTSALYFTGPRTVQARPLALDPLADGEVLVETAASAISAGTELLVYRDQTPENMVIDEALTGFEGDFTYPMQYGYAAVGQVVETGSDVETDWLGQTVFSFTPHQTQFTASPEELVSVPDGMAPAHATLLPTLETATNLVLDCHPRLGEHVVVFGAGIVGLCVTRLLAAFPLESLVVVDPLDNRRAIAREMGADRAIHPDAVAQTVSDVDLAVELSGQPDVLNDALGVVGYDGRIVIGSWYGAKQTPVDFGGRFHRNRIELISSQVSTIDPELRGRWDKDRRFETALGWLERIDSDRLISHRIPFSEAQDAYELLDQQPEPVLQVVMTY